MKLQTKIALGLVAGILVGLLARLPALAWFRQGVIALEPVGTVFIRLITMVVVPLVVASLFVGIAGLGDLRRLGAIGGKTLAYFASTTLIAATIGASVAGITGIGAGSIEQLRDAMARQPAANAGNATTSVSFVQSLIDMTPQNPFAAAAQGDLLPLIIAVCVFAAAATLVPASRRQTLVGFFEAVNDVAMVVIGWLMRLAPPAVFVLIAVTVARSGLDLLASLLAFAGVVLLAMVIHVLVTLLPALRFGARLGAATFVRSVSDALLLAFSSASSSATLPVSMAAATGRLGIPKEIVGFVLPAGATLNKNGAAIYKAATAIFLARLYGIELGGAQWITVVLTASAASFAGAGVPGSSLVTTLIVLNAVGLGPNAAAGIALVASIDRPLDMCRTLVNTIGNLVGTAWIGRSEEPVSVLAPSAQ